MTQTFGRSIRRKLHLGKVGIPVWAAGLALALTAAAAGQAVGPVLTGSTSGSVNLVVEQAIALDVDTYDLGENPSASGDDYVTTRNDEGTAFTVAIELNQGQTAYVCLNLENSSGAAAAAILELNVPAGIDVEVEEYSGSTDQTASAQTCSASMNGLGTATMVDEAQLSRNTWLMAIASGAGNSDANGDGVQIKIESKDDIAPGFYAFSGRILQTSGG